MVVSNRFLYKHCRLKKNVFFELPFFFHSGVMFLKIYWFFYDFFDFDRTGTKKSSQNRKKIRFEKKCFFFSLAFLHKNRSVMTKNTRNLRKYSNCLPLCSQVVFQTLELYRLKVGHRVDRDDLPIFPW